MKDLVAISNDWGIGIDNCLLFRIPEDVKFFKEITMGKVVFMGKNTLDSLPGGKPLKNRINIVLTNKDIDNKDIISVHSVEEALEELKKYNSDDIYNIGGGKIFEQFLDYMEYSLVTKVDFTCDAAVHYPNIDKLSNWEIIEESEEKEYEGIKYKFYTYRNNNFIDIFI